MVGFTKGVAPLVGGVEAVVSAATAGVGAAGWSPVMGTLVEGALLQAPNNVLAIAMSRAGNSLFMARELVAHSTVLGAHSWARCWIRIPTPLSFTRRDFFGARYGNIPHATDEEARRGTSRKGSLRSNPSPHHWRWRKGNRKALAQRQHAPKRPAHGAWYRAAFTKPSPTRRAPLERTCLPSKQ